MAAKTNEVVNLPVCCKCGVHSLKIQFYNSKNPIHVANAGKLPWCQKCVKGIYADLLTEYGDKEFAIYYLCRKLDVFFSSEIFNRAQKSAERTSHSIVSEYIAMFNAGFGSTGSNVGSCFGESRDFLDLKAMQRNAQAEAEAKYKKRKEKKGKDPNEEDCINLLGYDPFEDSSEDERRYLFNTLVGFLDDVTLETPLRKSQVIHLVATLGQINKLDLSINALTEDASATEENSLKLSSLIASKEKLSSTCLKIAKENGISISASGQRVKGAGTLTAVVKELEEIGLEEAKPNLYDMKTTKAMKQIADVSNQSILEQINLQDNEKFEMIRDARIIRVNLEKKIAKTEEELRKEQLRNSELTYENEKMKGTIKTLESHIMST